MFGNKLAKVLFGLLSLESLTAKLTKYDTKKTMRPRTTALLDFEKKTDTNMLKVIQDIPYNHSKRNIRPALLNLNISKDNKPPIIAIIV